MACAHEQMSKTERQVQLMCISQISKISQFHVTSISPCFPTLSLTLCTSMDEYVHTYTLPRMYMPTPSLCPFPSPSQIYSLTSSSAAGPAPASSDAGSSSMTSSVAAEAATASSSAVTADFSISSFPTSSFAAAARKCEVSLLVRRTKKSPGNQYQGDRSVRLLDLCQARACR